MKMPTLSLENSVSGARQPLPMPVLTMKSAESTEAAARQRNSLGLPKPTATAKNSETESGIVPLSRAIELSNARIRYNRAKSAVEADKHSVGDIYSGDESAREAERARREQNEKKLATATEMMKRLGLQEEVDPSLGERVQKTVTGSAKSYAGRMAGAIGAYTDAAGRLSEAAANATNNSGRVRAAEREAMRYRQLAEATEDAERREEYERKAERASRKARAVAPVEVNSSQTDAIAQNLYRNAGNLSDSAAQDLERAQQGLGTPGRLAVAGAGAALQMGADIGLGALTGLGNMVPMMVRSFGGGAQEARRKGYSHNQQMLMGLTTAATEYFTEKLFGGNPVYDADAGLVNRLVDKVVKNDSVKRWVNTLSDSVLSEGLEEMISDVLEPVAEWAITGNRPEYELDQIIEDGIVGVMVGAIGKGVNLALPSVTARRNEAGDLSLPTPGSIEAGNDSSAANGGAEAQKNAASNDESENTPNAVAATLDLPNPTERAETERNETSVVQHVQRAIPSMQNDTPVAILKGTEIPVGDRVVDRLVSFANSIGNKVHRNGFGDVLFSKSRIKNAMIGHGFSKAKVDTFAAVPAVIRNGVQIGHETNWKGRGYETFLFAAPVEYRGDRSYVGVVVSKDATDGRYYVHEVVDGNGNVLLGEEKTQGMPSDGRASLAGTVDTVASPVISDNTIPQASNVVNRSLDLQTPGNSQTIGNLAETAQETEQEPTEAEPSAEIRDTLPYKAQTYLERAERAFLRRIGDALSVPRTAQRDSLKEYVRAMSEKYLQTGQVSQETVNDLFEQAYAQGIVIDSEFYDQYRDLKDLLRTTPVSLGEDYQADIPDFNEFRKAAFGTLRISNDGTPVDIVYEEMREKAPELFPAGITNPAEQMQRMYEVGKSIARVETDLAGFYGDQAEDFKRWAKHDFENAVNSSLTELRTVKRYADERKTAKREITETDVRNAFANIRKARKAADRAKAKNLMTEYDDAQVGRLLKGEIELADLDPDRANVKGIREVYEASKEYEAYAQTIKEFNKQRKSALLDEADQFLTTANDWKDKPAGLLYSRETMRRNIRDIVKDKDLAKQIFERYFEPVSISQAESARFKNAYRDRVRALNLSRDVAEGNTVSEAHAVQLLGEAEDNIRVLNESRKAGETRDGKTAQEWEAAIRELWDQSPNLDRAKIENAVKEFRGIYDELFERMNEVRVRNGYEPVGYRQGYFPHFQPGETEGVIASFAKALGIDTDVQTLPTTINGLTHTFRPGISWFGAAQERLGFNTAYDAVEGFDKYVEGVSDVIHQTDNIQRLRALAQQIRYRTGDEGMRKQMDAIRADNTLDEETKSEKLDKLKESGRYTLGNFVVELDEYTNQLANKKSQADRQMEHDAGRKSYKVMKGLESRVAANMVAVNPGSWLTNFIPLTQGWATLDTKNLLRGMGQTLKAYKTDDGMVYRSTFLTNRRGSDPIVKAWAEKASAKLSKPMEYIDQFTADSLVRARVLQNTEQGLSEDAAIREADVWAAGIMADRSKGAMPTLFNRKNPATKLFTQFQLEVNNEFSNLFKDVPEELKKKGTKALAAGLLKFFVGAWLYNEVYEYIVGRRAALDPIGLLNDTVGDLTGYELPNLIEGAQGLANGEGADVFRTDRTGTYQAVANLAGSAAEELPFVGGVLGGGRVPLMNAIPTLENLGKAALNDQWSGKKRLSTAAKELSAPLTYLALPFGGGQMKKIYQGISAVMKGGSYSVDSQGRDILQYPVYNDTLGDIAGNAARAVLFGKSSLPGAREWVESGFDSFSAKETAVYQGMNDAGVSDREALALLQDLRSAQKTDEESANTIKRRIIMDSDLTGEGKSVAYYGMLATEKERALMDELSDIADMGTATEMLVRLKDSPKSKQKYQTLLNANLPELGKRMSYRFAFGEDDEKTLNKLSTQGVGIDDWLSYRAQTADLTADKDSNGKTVSGSLKAKEIAVIDALPLTTSAKDALYLATGHTESTLEDAPWHTVSSLALPRVGGYAAPNLTLPQLSLPALKLPRS